MIAFLVPRVARRDADALAGSAMPSLASAAASAMSVQRRADVKKLSTVDCTALPATPFVVVLIWLVALTVTAGVE